MKKIIVFTLILVLCKIVSNAQNYPSGFFIAPLDPPLIITGTFGEIRDNHFHSGLDLGTEEEEGLPVMAAADGYISRIKIAPDGYGKALYVTHPNGYVTVYGHLQKFTANVNSFIRKLQYERQSFELDINPKETDFPVKQRDVIAYSGSTGGAQAPHVHFEIRDEKTEEPINPLLFGLPVSDTRAPEFTAIGIYPQRENGILNTTDSAEMYEVKNTSGFWELATSSIPVVYGNVGFGFAATDYQDSLESSLGIYASELYVDGKLEFSMKYDRFNFDDTRYTNAHIDYRLERTEGYVMERTHKFPGDHLKLYGDDLQTGFVNLGDDGSHSIRIVVMDFNGNKTQIEFRVISSTSLRAKLYMPRPENSVLVSNEKGLALHKSNYDVLIPEKSLYEDFYYSDEESKSVYYSDIFRIGDVYEPMHMPMTIGIKPNKDIVDSLKFKAVIVRIDEFGEMTSCGGLWNDKMLTAKSNEFGTFAVILDTVPPAIEKYYVPADMNTMYGGVVQIKVKDALSNLTSYSGTIDGKWHLFEYDKKNDMIIGDVQSMDVNKMHDIEITATDGSGNTRVWKSAFWY